MLNDGEVRLQQIQKWRDPTQLVHCHTTLVVLNTNSTTEGTSISSFGAIKPYPSQD